MKLCSSDNHYTTAPLHQVHTLTEKIKIMFHNVYCYNQWCFKIIVEHVIYCLVSSGLQIIAKFYSHLFVWLHTLRVHLITCQLFNISVLKCYACDAFLIEFGNWFQCWLVCNPKVLKPLTLGKFRRFVVFSCHFILFWENLVHEA